MIAKFHQMLARPMKKILIVTAKQIKQIRKETTNQVSLGEIMVVGRPWLAWDWVGKLSQSYNPNPEDPHCLDLVLGYSIYLLKP